MKNTQDFSNHTRWHPIFHFVLVPLMLINFIFSVVRLFQNPGWDSGEFVLLSVALVILTLVARTNAMKVQDRVIRLEERLRFAKILPADLAEKASDLRTSQIIALRFASDEELSGLVQKVLDGELTGQKEIKAAVKNWRGDYLRV